MAGLSVDTLVRTATLAVQRMAGPQRVTLALAFVATALSVFLVARMTGTTPMSTLYADLEPSTAAAIVTQLDSQGIPYELSNGGRIIEVPSDQVHATRLAMSSQGLPDSGEGWSILDNQGITTSAFDQRVGYQRAMEGELAKTIAAIDGVASADVHLAIPERDLIIDDGKQASASILLVTSGSQPITPMQVEAIVNLVASSVEGLQPDQVSVADEKGQVLAAPGEGVGVVGLEGDSQLRAKHQYESVLEDDLESMLAAVVGPGLAVVTVAVELDFDSVVTVTEKYQPTETTAGDQLMLGETTRAEIYRGEDVGTTEDGELAIELPAVDETADPEAAATIDSEGVKYSLDERDVTFAVDKVITNTENAFGEVSSLSVAVLLDEQAIDAELLAELENLIQAAAGINLERGDTLAVSLMPLNEEFRQSLEAAAAGVEPESGGGLDIIGLIRMVVTAIVALVVILLGLRYVSRGSKREVIDSYDLPQLEAITSAVDAATALGITEKVDPPDVKLQNLIANQSDDVSGVLRSWLNEHEEVAR